MSEQVDDYDLSGVARVVVTHHVAVQVWKCEAQPPVSALHLHFGEGIREQRPGGVFTSAVGRPGGVVNVPGPEVTGQRSVGLRPGLKQERVGAVESGQPEQTVPVTTHQVTIVAGRGQERA